MDEEDRTSMSQDLSMTPVRVDSSGVSLARRPRLYWCTWELQEEAGLQLAPPQRHGWGSYVEVSMQATIDPKDFLEAGWEMFPNGKLATFTTSRPSSKPGRKPAGLHHCDEATRERWKADLHRYPPYQYKPEFCLHRTKTKEIRVASIAEREVILGFPLHYTQHCMSKQHRVGHLYEDTRKTLLGNSWSVPVVAILMKQFFQQLGLMEPCSIQDLIQNRLHTVLQRPPLRRMLAAPSEGLNLAARMVGLVSVKGEDLLLQSSTDVLVKSQRFRHTVPAKAWQWKEVTGWSWKQPGEHINQLEMRAVHTTLKGCISGSLSISPLHF